MEACIFCKIAAGELPAKEVYRDEEIVAIEDLNPRAPAHILVMPCKHFATLHDLTAGDREFVGRLFEVATRIGRERGSRGYRLVVNTGADGGQTVDHVHVHVLAGRHMTWPPG